MSSKKQITANRRNGVTSNGPVSTEGKAVSAKNSLKHGLTSSREVLMPNEDSTVFATFCEHLRAELNPGGELESVLTERIIGVAWRLRRLGQIEAGILTWRYYEVPLERAGERATKYNFHDKLSRDLEEHALTPAELEERKQALAEQQQHRSAQETDL